MTKKKQNLRQCKNCKKRSRDYVLINGVSAFCDFKCATEYATQPKKIAQGRRKANRQARQKMRDLRKKHTSLHEYTKKAQAAFNSYIRARDMNKPCISSGAPLKAGIYGGGFDCGHYRSVGSAPHLRFNVFNAHGQTKRENRYLSGNTVDYRRGLIQRIGLDRVEKLEAEQAPKKYSKHELERIRRIFSKRARLYLKLFR